MNQTKPHLFVFVLSDASTARSSTCFIRGKRRNGGSCRFAEKYFANRKSENKENQSVPIPFGL